MKLSRDRRSFLRTMGGLALASTVGTVQSLGSLKRLIVPPDRKPRVLIIALEGFPVTDGIAVSQKDLEKAFEGWETEFVQPRGLAERLLSEHVDLLVTAHGSAFPLAAWDPLLQYLGSGGSWLNLGGSPLAIPVTLEGTTWKKGPYNPNMHKRIGITQTFPVSTVGVAHYVGNDLVDGSEELLAECSVTKVYELYVRFTSSVDFPSESGCELSRSSPSLPRRSD
jgi:hypothetical protein